MADARTGNNRQKTVEQAGARAQNRNEDELLAVDQAPCHLFEGRFDIDFMHRHLARHFVCHQRRHLGQQASKARRARRLPAHERELVLNQRMIEDVDVARQFTGLGHQKTVPSDRMGSGGAPPRNS